jgi:hypothetical protein
MDGRSQRREPYANYVVPVVLVVVVMVALTAIPDPFQLLLPLIAFASGYYFQPRRVVVIWAASWIIVAAVLSSMLLLGFHPPKAVDQGPVSAVSLGVDALLYALYLAVLVLIPLWLGRAARRRRSRAHRPA